MKSWCDLTLDERQDRLGDPAVSRSNARSEYENEMVNRFVRGLPLSMDGKRRARRLLRDRKELCDCAAEQEGKWADIHHPNCAVFNPIAD